MQENSLFNDYEMKTDNDRSMLAAQFKGGESSSSKKQEEIIQLITDCDKSLETQFKMFKEIIGKPVKYGDNIMLLHHFSGMFLELKKGEGYHSKVKG